MSPMVTPLECKDNKVILKIITITLMSWIHMNGLKIYKYFQKHEYVRRTYKVYNFTI